MNETLNQPLRQATLYKIEGSMRADIDRLPPTPSPIDNHEKQTQRRHSANLTFPFAGAFTGRSKPQLL
jgi:hypothetical protein